MSPYTPSVQPTKAPDTPAAQPTKALEAPEASSDVPISEASTYATVKPKKAKVTAATQKEKKGSARTKLYKKVRTKAIKQAEMKALVPKKELDLVLTAKSTAERDELDDELLNLDSDYGTDDTKKVSTAELAEIEKDLEMSESSDDETESDGTKSNKRGEADSNSSIDALSQNKRSKSDEEA